jgi:hypothetical protein
MLISPPVPGYKPEVRAEVRFHAVVTFRSGGYWGQRGTTVRFKVEGYNLHQVHLDTNVKLKLFLGQFRKKHPELNKSVGKFPFYDVDLFERE